VAIVRQIALSLLLIVGLLVSVGVFVLFLKLYYPIGWSPLPCHPVRSPHLSPMPRLNRRWPRLSRPRLCLRCLDRRQKVRRSPNRDFAVAWDAPSPASACDLRPHVPYGRDHGRGSDRRGLELL